VSTQFDVIIIGAGVIGLAIARAIALAGRSVLIVERRPQFGSETSARNSEVIHAGIYYPPGSAKARLCVAGKAMLYDFCAARGVPHRRCGKLIVAADEGQIGQLDQIRQQAAACEVEDLVPLASAEAARLEPDVTCAAALLSPSTGIIDSHAYMQALLGEAEAHGALLVTNTEVTAVRPNGRAWSIWIAGEAEPVAAARTIINSAGLAASELAGRIEGFPVAHRPVTRLAKGCYFSYAGRTDFRHLIYPLPEPGGLGTHLTLDMAGRARFGPDVEWVDVLDYSVDPGRRAGFAAAIRRYWPGVDADRLQPDYAGIRPKLSKPGEAAADFCISGPAEHGVAGIVNLFGIESPGLTASLAIADEVRGLALAA